MKRTLLAIVALFFLCSFRIYAAPAPVIYLIDIPEAWYAGSWYPINIYGANLTGTTKVTIAGNPATAVVVVDDGKVTFMAPAQVPSPVTNPSVAYARADLVLTAPGGDITVPQAIQYNPPAGTGVTAKGSDWAVLVDAVVSENPPSITLKWPSEDKAVKYEISRKELADKVWTPVGTSPGNSTSWHDTNIMAGKAYEYQIKRTTTILAYIDSSSPRSLIGLTSYGYIYSGINIPPIDHRGTVILIVDNTIAKPCSSELNTLQNDLVGDGWSVIRHDVARGNVNNYTPVAYEKTGAPTVKQLIVNEYLKNPKEVKSVLLFGHVPVPYSGNLTSAGHAPGHTGAFPADVYYGDMDGVWTDNVVNVETADAKSLYYTCFNIPGDGKFDQSWVPSEVELEVGRVDLSGMAANEIQLLKQYITKNHNHRYAVNILPRRSLIMEGSGDNWMGISQSGWRSWSPLVGSGNLDNGWFYPKLVTNNEAYLGFNLTGSGDNARVGSGNRTTTVYSNDYLNKDIKTLFCMSWGSHHGDWDHPQNLLRAPLTSSTFGLASISAFNPSGNLHTLGIGGTFGEAIRLKQNNTTTYSQYNANDSGGIHIALMGDPTLRLFAVTPPSELTITKDGNNHPLLSWQASKDDALLGYYVYRSADKNGPFTRLTPKPVTQTTWTDNSITSGIFTYQVKAAKLETTASGTYINTSQAIDGTITAAENNAGTIEFSTSSYAQDEGAAIPLQITVTRNGGSTGAISVSYATRAGTATAGADYIDTKGILTWADGDSSPKSFTIKISNDFKTEPDETVNIILSSPAGGANLGSNTSVFTISNDDGPGVIYQVSPVAVNEGNDGITKMTITCLRIGGAEGKVSMSYETIDSPQRVSVNYPNFPCARSWRSDFVATKGTLTWNDGDTTPKTFDINVMGNNKPDYDKYILIQYNITEGNATVQHPKSFHNYILNDDGK
jgi:hypothetical protein